MYFHLDREDVVCVQKLVPRFMPLDMGHFLNEIMMWFEIKKIQELTARYEHYTHFWMCEFVINTVEILQRWPLQFYQFHICNKTECVNIHIARDMGHVKMIGITQYYWIILLKTGLLPVSNLQLALFWLFLKLYFFIILFSLVILWGLLCVTIYLLNFIKISSVFEMQGTLRLSLLVFMEYTKPIWNFSVNI